MAINELARLAREAESDAAKIAAIKELLDRGYGKAPQPIDGDGKGGPIQIVSKQQRDAAVTAALRADT
ncbi:hypothetical protein [Methylocystis sp. S23]